MKRSDEKVLQSAFNRFMYDFIQLNPIILESELAYNEFLQIIDNILAKAIVTYRKHTKSSKDFNKTLLSRLARCKHD